MLPAKKLFIIIPLSLLLILAGMLLAAPRYNDNLAKQTANQLAGLPLPDNTQLIESVCQAGKLTGSGNGMQYFGAILVKSELPLANLQAYYAQFAPNSWSCLIEAQTTPHIQFIEHTNLSFNTPMTDGSYFIIYTWASNHTIFHELDLRGH